MCAESPPLLRGDWHGKETQLLRRKGELSVLLQQGLSLHKTEVPVGQHFLIDLLIVACSEMF